MSLFELCGNYIDYSNTLQGEISANETIYNYCFAYLNDYCTKKEIKTLKTFFTI